MEFNSGFKGLNRTRISGTLLEDQHTFLYHISISSSYDEKCFRQVL